MTRDEVRNDYFSWLYDIVCENRITPISYKKLLMYLHNTEFRCVLSRDMNRAGYGEALRYRFALMQPHEDLIEAVQDCLDEPCSVLEMMIALALQMETIMEDPEHYGDRTTQWFWGMIVNMGLGGMNDDRYHRPTVEMAVDRMLDRTYDQDGRGGLFTVERCHRDLRNVEIWQQMLWYTNTIS